MMTNTDVTLYRRSASSGTETWTRKGVIADVLWEDRKAENVVRSGLLDADRAWVYIPMARNATVKPGDVLVKGVVDKTINASYPLSKLHADCTAITVRSVDTFDFGSPSMQHLQIGGA